VHYKRYVFKYDTNFGFMRGHVMSGLETRCEAMLIWSSHVINRIPLANTM